MLTHQRVATDTFTCTEGSSVPPFFNHFSLSQNRKKRESHEKETKRIHASAADLLHTVLEKKILIGANADEAK